MVSGRQYDIEFSGRVVAGWDIDEVKANLAKLLKADEEKIYKLFSGGRFILKKNIDYQAAIKIHSALKKYGADCIIAPAQGSPDAAPPPIPSHTGAGQPDQGSAAGAKPALEPSGIRPKKFWYLVAILFFLILMIAGGITIFHTITSYFSGGIHLAVPGETTIEATEPGTYLILYETSALTEFNISNTQMGQDFDIAIMDLVTGEQLELQPAAFGGTETYGAIIRQAIAEIKFETVGNYHAEVTGELPESDGLLVRRVDFAGIIKGIVAAFALFFLGITGGSVMALVALVKRQKYKNAQLSESISEDQERKWAMFAHLGTFSSMFVPLGNIIAPIVIWQIKKKDSPFVVEQAKESLNFQITLMIYALISILLAFIVIGFFLIFGLVIFSLIFVIIAAVRANDGEHFRYPITLRLIK